MTGICPILFGNERQKYNLTDDEIARFCRLGCSVDCDIFLKEYVERLRKKKGARSVLKIELLCAEIAERSWIHLRQCYQSQDIMSN